MSHELLLAAGNPNADSAAVRRNRVEAAARRLHGYRSARILEGAAWCLALAETCPAGGTFSRIDDTSDGGTMVAIGTSREGVDAAWSPVTSADAGAEAGHVAIRLAPHGAVSVQADGAAYLPAYWATVNEGFLFSTHLASLISLGLPAQIDEQGLSEYLVTLHPFGDRTLIRGAKIVGAGATIRWEIGSHVSVSTKPIFSPSSDSMDDSQAIHEFGNIWASIIEDVGGRTSGERPMLSLSGGLDSRAIALQSVEVGFKPMTYTYGSNTTNESRVASRVAAALDLPHAMIPISDSDIMSGAAEAIQLLDGAHSPAEMYELWFKERLGSMTSAIINGHAGGPLWGDDKGLGSRSFGEAVTAQWERYAGEARAIAGLVEPDFRGDLPRRIRSGIAASMSLWDTEWRGDTVNFWAFANRQTRWGGMLINALRRIGIRAEAPFLDARFLLFAARMTSEQRRNGRLYLRVHRELFAKTAEIPRSDDGNPPNKLDHLYWSAERSYLRQLGELTKSYPLSGFRRALAGLGKVGASRAGSPTHLDWTARAMARRVSVFPADLWLRTRPAYSDRLVSLLDNAGGNEYFSASALEGAIRSVRAGSPIVGAKALARIAAAQAWLLDYRDRAEALK